MKSILLELEPSNKSAFSRGWMMLVGIVNVLQSFFQQNELRYIDLAFGIVLMVGGFYYWKLYELKTVAFDEVGIKGKLRFRTTIDIKWDDVSRFELAIYAISLITKSGQKYEIDLSNITYQQHKEIKPQIVELAKSKGIEVVAG